MNKISISCAIFVVLVAVPIWASSNTTSTSQLIHPDTACSGKDNEKKWLICQDYYVCPFDDSVGPNSPELGSTLIWGYEQSLLPCMSCPSEDPFYGQDCQSSIENMTKMFDLTPDSASTTLDLCRGLCESGLEGDSCSQDSPCTAGSHFCDFSNVQGQSGTCQECPEDVNECHRDGFLANDLGKTSCVECRRQTAAYGNSTLTVDGEVIPSGFVHLAIQETLQSASGPLIDCSDLIRSDVDLCKGADGHVCVIHDYTLNTFYWEVSDEAEDSGCVAIISFTDKNYVYVGHHSYDNLRIPFVFIPHEDGMNLIREKIGSTAVIDVQLEGLTWESGSSWGHTCSEEIDCLLSDKFCPFDRTIVGEEYVEGWCWPCPVNENGEPHPIGCYFDTDGGGYVRNAKYVQSCAKSCDAKLEFAQNCKFCPENVDSIDFGVEDSSQKCQFCPQSDVQFPDRKVPLFSDNITCWQMQAFYENVEIPNDSQNCLLAQSMNFICGCEGTGYAGANTSTKQVVLAWLPRAMAVLSVAGSLFIIYDILRVAKRRRKFANQLLITLSAFDLIGSIAYSLTTLPTPEADYIYGSRGNDKTCTAQGFFIQIGTIACFLNISLAVYYLLTIKYTWNEDRCKKKRVFFFVPPIIVGLIFAFAGIPFYDNMILWCNNGASWWPEIPVIIAILLATFIMGWLCHYVYENEKKSKRYTGGGARLSKMVFKQSCWFIGAFYITWVPYLALQYMWSSGKAFSHYGFILYAGSSVPLQGFWNFIVYAVPRFFKGSASKAANTTAQTQPNTTKNVASSRRGSNDTTDGGAHVGSTDRSALQAPQEQVHGH